MEPTAGVLYVVACAAPPAAGLHNLVSLAQNAGWTVHVVTTPMGERFVNVPDLERLTGDQVRSTYRMPGEPKGLPPADAVIVAPATFNTINKWATGIADTFAVGLLCEVMGFGVPILAVPMLKTALARHSAFARSVEALRDMGVQVMFDPDAPSDARMPSWEQVMEELQAVVGGRQAQE
ncbi:flavoprotein [Nonomuraea endophytica]|uniref:Phosphopantothenoylcysteine synthetase/decarboxylase n=1 Tax=Nonomuraea endophytica TaxID=714136 RepID=A0A7W8ECI7_9ACTN|nr:flavoprotein [Nonomuraea endophytica]MBB5075490.1 phosphopantothenoylcysteine synthetase/decarboxylase [Nonomuraea endophytica]